MQSTIISLYEIDRKNSAEKMTQKPLKSQVVFKLEGLINLFLRLLALVFIVFAVRYWLLVVGVSNSEIRFDTMPNHWKVAGTFFSVFYPIAALGLWGLFRWGIVIWFLIASLELVMYVFYQQLYGQHNSLVVFHLASMGTWLTYRLVEFLDEKRTLIQNSK